MLDELHLRDVVRAGGERLLRIAPGDDELGAAVVVQERKHLFAVDETQRERGA